MTPMLHIGHISSIEDSDGGRWVSPARPAEGDRPPTMAGRLRPLLPTRHLGLMHYLSNLL